MLGVTNELPLSDENNSSQRHPAKGKISRIKQQDAALRGYLAKLALYSYTAYEENETALLELNVAQAKKYSRYQFTFNPEKYDQQLFKAVFQGQDSGKFFQALKAAHPFGVQIWVNPHNAKHAPLLEHNFTLAAQSIISAARMLLADMRKQQEQIAKIKDELNNKYAFIKNKIENEYEKFIEELSKGGINFEKAERLLEALQSRIVYYLTSFEIQPSKHEKNDYKHTYKLLGVYEQKQKQGNNPDDIEGNEFNRDIFTLDLELNDEDNSHRYTIYSDDEDIISPKINNTLLSNIKARFRYHQRHCTATKKQIELRSIENQDGTANILSKPIAKVTEIVDSENKEKIPSHKNNKFADDTVSESEDTLFNEKLFLSNIIVEPIRTANIESDGNSNEVKFEPTETAHSPNYGLANYAIVEEGTYDSQEGTTIDFFNTRHGSAAPNELYTGKIKKLDRHEAAYRTYLNMQQSLQQLRAKVIESILKENKKKLNLTEEKIPKLSHEIAAEITETIINSNNTDGKLIFKCLEINDEDDNELKSVKNLLNNEENLAEIVNIKNFYNHVITPTGVGSLSEKQNLLYRDCRLAQYATQDKDGNAGYIYMSNGVNALRGDDTTFDAWHQKLEGNNCVALIELYKELPSFHKIETNEFSEYNGKLQEVRNTSRAYMDYIGNKYIKTKLEYDRLQENEKEFVELYKVAHRNLAGEYNVTELEQLETTCKANFKNKENLKYQLTLHEYNLKELKADFKTAEIELHKKAKELNPKIHEGLKEKSLEIDKLANDEKTRSQYLAYKGFALAEKLFNENNGEGVQLWKLNGYNGVMQALLQLSAEQMEIFGSYGCKSDNDRALLLALLISELSKLTSNNQVLNENYFNNLLKNCQQAYAWHISREQTALDRSAIPKTGSDILEYAKAILENCPEMNCNFEEHNQYGKIAAHKRNEMPKDFKWHLDAIPSLKVALNKIEKNWYRDSLFMSTFRLKGFDHYQIMVKENINKLIDSIESLGTKDNQNALKDLYLGLEHLVNTKTVKDHLCKESYNEFIKMKNIVAHILLNKSLNEVISDNDLKQALFPNNLIHDINQEIKRLKKSEYNPFFRPGKTHIRALEVFRETILAHQNNNSIETVNDLIPDWKKNTSNFNKVTQGIFVTKKPTSAAVSEVIHSHRNVFFSEHRDKKTTTETFIERLQAEYRDMYLSSQNNKQPDYRGIITI